MHICIHEAMQYYYLPIYLFTQLDSIEEPYLLQKAEGWQSTLQDKFPSRIFVVRTYVQNFRYIHSYYVYMDPVFRYISYVYTYFFNFINFVN